MTHSTEAFYNDLAPDYHLVFQDWDASMQKQATALQNVIESHSPRPVATILDASCGIGTQALGLAQKGFTLTGSDLSPKAIERATKEAMKRGLSIDFYVSSFEDISTNIPQEFDALISCDNSLPHLLSRDALNAAATAFYSTMKPGGLCLITVRDYDALVREKPTKTSLVVTQNPDGTQSASFQLWSWESDHVYTTDHISVLPTQGGYTTRVRTVNYRAYTRSEITDVFTAAGFTGTTWLFPEASGYYQPIMIAHKPS